MDTVLRAVVLLRGAVTADLLPVEAATADHRVARLGSEDLRVGMEARQEEAMAVRLPAEDLRPVATEVQGPASGLPAGFRPLAVR